MSGNGKKILETIEEVLKEITSLKKQVKDLEKSVKQKENQSNIDSETLQHIHSVVSDISCKLDEGTHSIATTSTKKSTTKSSKTSDSKPKLNIMTFFKQKYKEDPDSMKKIVSKEEIEKLFKDHADELGKKKKNTLQQAQVSLIYKELIKDSSDKLEKLRKFKKQEEDKEEAEGNNSSDEVEADEADIADNDNDNAELEEESGEESD